MSMVVKNNIPAVRTLGTLNQNSTALSKSLQKVSTGMKINSAADDNSAWSISERMRVRIRGLDQADQNTQNGRSLLKVAEGSVQSTIDLLRTLKEKAINAANDTNTDADRQTIQKELDQSIDQIDDNANVTYNGKILMDGSKNTLGSATFTALTNQSLSTATTATTLLTDLENRYGSNLGILTTDKITVSYVQGGRTYSTTFNVDANTRLNTILVKAEAIDPLTKNFATKTNKSVATIQGVTDLDALIQQEAALTAARDTAYGNYLTAKAESDKAYAAKSRIDPTLDTIGALVAGASSTVQNQYNSLRTSYASIFAAAAQDLRNYLTTVSGGSDAINNYSVARENIASGNTDNDATLAASYAAKKATTDSLYATYLTAQSQLDNAAGPQILDGNELGLAKSGETVKTVSGTSAITITAAGTGIGGQISGFSIRVTDSNGNVKTSANTYLDAFSESIRAENESEDNALTIHVGADPGVAIKVGMTDMRSEALGLKGADGTKLDISTQERANAAISVLDNAIQKALNQQADIGNIASRLEYTSANLRVASDNVQASESTIRDADMAKEMTAYTKNNVLLSASQSMLSQANQNSMDVMTLLQ